MEEAAEQKHFALTCAAGLKDGCDFRSRKGAPDEKLALVYSPVKEELQVAFGGWCVDLIAAKPKLKRGL